MNFGTIPGSQLTVDLAGSAEVETYLLALVTVAGLVLGVLAVSSLASRIRRGRDGSK